MMYVGSLDAKHSYSLISLSNLQNSSKLQQIKPFVRMVTMTDAQLPVEVVDINYFVCTLGQAAASIAEKPRTYKTVNDFIDHQAREHPSRPAVGFPIPPKDKEPDLEWNYAVYTFQDLQRLSIALSYKLLEYGPLSASRPVQANRTVAFVCPSSIDFLFGWLALMRLGCSVLLIAL